MPRILVGTDFSPHADRALDVAVALARSLGAGIELIHVRGEPAFVGVDAVAFASIEAAVRDGEDRALAEQAARVRAAGVPCATVQRSGRPWEEIVHHAGAGRFDWVVLGTRGRGAAAGLLLGSVTQRVVARSPCPVIAVPPAR